jgi:hypothetical protein
MKQQLIPLILLLLIPAATALYGGESITYHLEKCNYLTTIIQPSELGEWTISNCTEKTPGFFNCTCEDDYTITLKPAINSIGTFNITLNITQDYTPETTTCPTCSGGGGGSYTRYVYINNTVTPQPPSPTNPTTCQTQPSQECVQNTTEKINVTTTIKKEVIKYQIPLVAWILIGAEALIIFVASVIIIRKNRKVKQNEQNRTVKII